jgi:hypothetical protein
VLTSERRDVLDQPRDGVGLRTRVGRRVVAVADAGVDRAQTGRRRGEDAVRDQARVGQLLCSLLQWRVDDVVSTDDDVLPRRQGHPRELGAFRHAPDRLDEPGP